ncbi:MAG TPA: sigma-70 family RNA polymerase sigma factor [Acidimicrobiia bacterium]|nr:sigma-70 family RNA polymerase sigma factor [Acidimicrobiia bacterium]
MDGLDYSDDAVLVKALTARDANAFSYLLDRYNGSFVRVARQYVPNQAVAEEVAQETWLAVIEGIDRFELRASVKTWLFRILVNIARARGVKENRTVPFASTAELAEEPAVDPHRFRRLNPRTRGHWKRPPQPWDDPEQLVLDGETLDAIRTTIDGLPPDQRVVITMRDVLGLSAQEVCDSLEVSDNNQRVLLHRARSKVRTALERHYDQVRGS